MGIQKLHETLRTPVRRLQLLRNWMENTGCRQVETAAKIGITDSHLSNILSGGRSMTLELALRTSVVTGIPVERLCDDKDALRILKLYGERQNHAA